MISWKLVSYKLLYVWIFFGHLHFWISQKSLYNLRFCPGKVPSLDSSESVGAMIIVCFIVQECIRFYYNKLLILLKCSKIFLSCSGRIIFNSLWPNDTIWQQRSGSTVAQVMACCLTASSHYLNQCWLIISNIQLHSSYGNFTRDTSVIND